MCSSRNIALKSDILVMDILALDILVPVLSKTKKTFVASEHFAAMQNQNFYFMRKILIFQINPIFQLNYSNSRKYVVIIF